MIEQLCQLCLPMNKTLHDVIRKLIAPEGTLKIVKRAFAVNKVKVLRFQTRSWKGLPIPISRKPGPLTLRKYIILSLKSGGI